MIHACMQWGAVGSSVEQWGAVGSSEEQWGAVGSSRSSGEQWGAVSMYVYICKYCTLWNICRWGSPPPPPFSTITPCISMTLIQSPVCFLYCVGSRRADWAMPVLFLAFAVICRQVGLQQQCDMRKLRVLCPVEGRQGRVPVNTPTRIPRPPARDANEETSLVVHGPITGGPGKH